MTDIEVWTLFVIILYLTEKQNVNTYFKVLIILTLLDVVHSEKDSKIKT